LNSGMRLRASSTLPRLAWLADYDRRTNCVEVLHGAGTESREGEWIVEGVWDGSFEDGAFERSPAFFGTGVKLTDHGLLLVPSTGIVDRIILCELDGHVVASNSLALALAHTGATPDPDHNYRAEAFAATKGIATYNPEIQVRHPGIRHFQQRYYSPLLVTPSSIELQERDEISPFPDYEAYLDCLRRTLAAIGANSRSPLRRNAVSLFTTLSAGYDSVAVTTLVRDLRIECAYTSRRSNSTILPLLSHQASIDDGTPIADVLSVPVRYLERRSAPSAEFELQFLAPSANDPELIFHTLAKDLESHAGVSVVFMGYHGDKVWDRNLAPALADDQLKRGDMSGLNLSEIRLQAGFIVATPAFIGARRIADLLRISNSAEMAPWVLGTDYDRPIPRRISEDAGVPRSLFGHRKRAVVQYRDFPRHPDLRRRFLKYVTQRRGWSPTRVRVMSRINRLAFPFLRAIQMLARPINAWADRIPLNAFGGAFDLPADLHSWALAELARVYAERLGEMRAPEVPGREARASLTT
jgi:hypothetical protein